MLITALSVHLPLLQLFNSCMGSSQLRCHQLLQPYGALPVRSRPQRFSRKDQWFSEALFSAKQPESKDLLVSFSLLSMEQSGMGAKAGLQQAHSIMNSV